VNPTVIREQVNRIQAMRGRLQKELFAIQDSCPHTNKRGEYKANTGNWSQSDDSYWIDVNCDDCGKWWLIDSDQPDYSQFDGVITR